MSADQAHTWAWLPVFTEATWPHMWLLSCLDSALQCCPFRQQRWAGSKPASERSPPLHCASSDTFASRLPRARLCSPSGLQVPVLFNTFELPSYSTSHGGRSGPHSGLVASPCEGHLASHVASTMLGFSTSISSFSTMKARLMDFHLHLSPSVLRQLSPRTIPFHPPPLPRAN